MARLPDATALGERPTPQASGAVASYRPQGDNLGAQIASAGQDLQQAAAIVADTNKRQDTIAAEAALNRLQQERVTLEFDPKSGFRSVKQGGAVGEAFVDGYMKRYDDATNLIAEGLVNEQQKALFKQRAPVVGLQYRSSLLQHQSNQTEEFNNATEKSTLDLQVQAVAMQPTNDIVLQTSLVRMGATIDAMAQRRGLPPEQVADLKSKYMDAAYSSRVMSNLIGIPGVVEANPYVARDMLEKSREKMLPDTVLRLSRETTTAIRMLENAARIENDKRRKEAENATEELFKFAQTGALPSEAYQAEVKAKTAGFPDLEKNTEVLIQQATVGAMHGSRSVPQQEQSIRAMEARAAQGSSPEIELVIKAARQITDTQAAAYKENPWAASARFQRLPSVPDKPLPQAEAVPSYVQQMLPFMEGVEAAGGTPVSPLQPAQAQAFSEQLSKLPAGPRADVLGQTGGLLNAPRILALADQLDKSNKPLALALKLGAGRTTLDRANAETLLRGADAIRDKTVKKDDTVLTGWRSEIAGLVRGTLGDKKAEDDAIDAAFYVRAGMEEPDYQGRASNETAVSLVLGRPYEVAGVKTVLPKGMSVDDFEDKIRAYTPDKLSQIVFSDTVYIRGQPRSVQQLSRSLPSMGLKRNPQGGYTPVSGNAFVTLDEGGAMPLNLEVQ
jgi:hypothetical protein